MGQVNEYKVLSNIRYTDNRQESKGQSNIPRHLKPTTHNNYEFKCIAMWGFIYVSTPRRLVQLHPAPRSTAALHQGVLQDLELSELLY